MEPQRFILDETSNLLTLLNPSIKEKQLPINLTIQYNEGHYSGVCKIGDIINFGWINWNHNRSLIDPDRVIELEKYILENNSIDWLLYFAYCHSIQNIKESTLEIYDGFHRMTALHNHIIKYEQFNHVLSPLRNATILISIKLFPSKREIVNAFIALNQSIPVNDLYKYIIVCDCIEKCECAGNNKAKHIEAVAKLWISRYAKHFKSSKKPIIPNINKNDFLEILSNIYDHFNFHAEIDLITKLDEINAYISNKKIEELPSISNITEKILEKCKQNGCFLFLIKKELLIEYIIYHSNE